MARYSEAGKDPYQEPGTGLLRNLVNASSAAELERIETAFSAVRAYELELQPVSGSFDLDHLCAVHRKLFGDVYPWAGEIRSVVIDKGTTRFAMPEHIVSAGRDLFRGLAKERQLRGLDPDAFSVRAGHYLGEINVLHPFREGNGRAQRAFLGQLAARAGYEISWAGVDREEMVRASILAYHSSSAGLARLIRDNLVDRDERRAKDFCHLVAGPDAVIEHATVDHVYAGRVIGTTDRYVIQERAGAPEELVLHARSRIAGDVGQFHGQQVEIAYDEKAAGVARLIGRVEIDDRERGSDDRELPDQRSPGHSREMDRGR